MTFEERVAADIQWNIQKLEFYESMEPNTRVPCPFGGSPPHSMHCFCADDGTMSREELIVHHEGELEILYK